MARFAVAPLRGEIRFSSLTFEIRQAGKPGRLSCRRPIPCFASDAPRSSDAWRIPWGFVSRRALVDLDTVEHAA
jgi:hypothetical protein